MSNLERIKEAWGMGWAAKIYPKGGLPEYPLRVVNISPTHVFLASEINVYAKSFDLINESFEITGYLYMGQLGGNEPVPEGTKFKLGSTGEILKSIIPEDDDPNVVWVESIDSNEYKGTWCKHYLEPIFD